MEHNGCIFQGSCLPICHGERTEKEDLGHAVMVLLIHLLCCHILYIVIPNEIWLI